MDPYPLVLWYSVLEHIVYDYP